MIDYGKVFQVHRSMLISENRRTTSHASGKRFYSGSLFEDSSSFAPNKIGWTGKKFVLDFTPERGKKKRVGRNNFRSGEENVPDFNSRETCKLPFRVIDPLENVSLREVDCEN